jgi:hypothetical protein
MSVEEVAKELVELCRQGKYLEAVDKLYDANVISIEPVDHGPEMPARIEGKAAVRAKNVAWQESSTSHGLRIDGPFLGGDQFALRFHIDSTPKATGQRMQISEMALYTVRDGKIVLEEFYYAPPPQP